MKMLQNNLFFSANIWLEALQEKENKKGFISDVVTVPIQAAELLQLNENEEVVFEKQDIDRGTEEANHIREIASELKHIPSISLAF